MLPGFDRLSDAADLTGVLDGGVADCKIFEGKFVSEGNGLFGARLQVRVVGEISSNTLGARFKIDNGNANVICGVMDKKVNHQLLLVDRWPLRCEDVFA